MKSGGQKNKPCNHITNAYFGMIGNLTPFTSVPSLPTPNNLGDLPDVRYNTSESSEVPNARRTSVVSNDSSSSISPLKMKISISFSKSSEDNEPIKQNSNSFDASTTRKSYKKGNRFSRLAKDISGKVKKNSFKHAHSDVGLQSHFSQGYYDMPSPMEDVCMHPVHGNSYVNNVLLELINTEKSYVRDLRDIEEGYRIPMSHDCNFSEEDIRSVFCNIKHIYDFSRKLLKRLTKHRLDVLEVCQVFLDNRDGFNIYTDYCTNYQRAVETLGRYKDLPECDDFIKHCQRLLKHPLPLHTYLFKPVQRILKYHLLLKNLAEHHDNSSPGFEVVVDAHRCMLEVAGDINEVKKVQEENMKVTQLLNSVQGLNGVNAESLGGLVIGGKLVSVGSREELKVFLMKKAILVTKKRKDTTLTFKMIIMCSNLILVEIIPRESLAFQVMGYDDPKKQCTLQAHSEEEKRIWCREIKKVILDSIKANVPEKARLLLMKPGLRQDAEETEVMHQMSRKMSENLDYLGLTTDRRGPKTSTPLQPFLRSKLRKTALAKFTFERKNKTKSNVGKRRSRSLENLHKFSGPFHSLSVNDSPEVKRVPIVEEDSQARDRGFVECLPAEESGFWSNSNPSDHNSSPKKSFKRTPSFKRALNDNNIYDFSAKPRISYTRSLSVTYPSSGDDDDDEEDGDSAGRVDSYSDSSPIVSEPLENFCFESNISSPDCDEIESNYEYSALSERNDSTITLSSGMSFNGNISSESPGTTAPGDPFEENIGAKKECSEGESEAQTSESEHSRLSSSECTNDGSHLSDCVVVEETLMDMNGHSVSEDFPEETSSCETIDDVDHKNNSFDDNVDLKCLLRDKNKPLLRRQENDRRSSLLKRKCAFYRIARKFVPRRSYHYVHLEEQRKSSLPTVFNVQGLEESVAPGDLKLALSEDSLPLFPPIDDDEMVGIIMAAAEESKVAEPEMKDEVAEGAGDVPVRMKDQVEGCELHSNRNSGVVGLLELIASCQDLSEEVSDSFKKIKVGEESGSNANGNPCVEKTADERGKIPEEDEAPILRDQLESNHLFRNKNYNYVFRLARAYSNKFKKLSNPGQDLSGTQSRSNQLHPHGASDDVKVSHLFDPGIQRAERSRIVKQRIQQFQHTIS